VIAPLLGLSCIGSNNTMLTCQLEELNVIEGSTCNYFCPKWKPTSCAMVAKVSQIASWVLVCSLP
jgi:hypothetical protein